MIRTVLERAAAAGIACAIVCAAFGQENPSAHAAPTPAAKPVEDEVVVTEQSPKQLRVDLEKAENAFYDRFNALNSSDEFDIHCRKEVPTGRRVPERVCLPNYIRDAQSQSGKSQTRGNQGSALAGDPQASASVANAKRVQLDAEMQNLARENADLQEALTRLVNAQAAVKASQKR
jgi:hypothetical protein